MRPIIVNRRQTIEGLVKFALEFSERYGPFVFFGFLWPEFYADSDSSVNPYIAAAAPWSSRGQPSDGDKAARKSFYKGVGEVLEIESWFMPPGSTLLSPNNEGLKPILDALEIEHDLVELVNVELFGQEVRRAYIITSQRLSPAVLEERI